MFASRDRVPHGGERIQDGTSWHAGNPTFVRERGQSPVIRSKTTLDVVGEDARDPKLHELAHSLHVVHRVDERDELPGNAVSMPRRATRESEKPTAHAFCARRTETP